jgi:glycolate oxidase FAD binding subunit
MTEQIQERVRAARSDRKSVRIAGRSTWLNAGRPVKATETLTVDGLSEVVDYVPGDLTITVGAGISLEKLATITREHNQWLPLNPFGSDDGTIGATIATGSYGPFAHGFGTIRDLVLGLQVVTGEAKIIRGGGRVVKNVAGFDLVRLMTGAWGTLGVITQATLRLYAMPSTRQTIAMEAPTDTRRLAERLRALQDASIIPFAVELLDIHAARSVGLPPRPVILIELGGNSAAVAAQTDTLRKLGALVDATSGMWDSLRKSEDRESTVFRISGLPSRVAERWERAANLLEGIENSMMHASVGRGTVRCIVPGELDNAFAQQLSSASADDTVILERAAPELWSRVAPSAIADRVSQSLKRAFDPSGILNPGILGVVN